MGDTRERPDNRLRCILIFNGPESAGEGNISRLAMRFFERLGFHVSTILPTDNINDLQEAVYEEVRKYRDVFWVGCVIAPGGGNLFHLNKGTADSTEKVSFGKVEKWFIENRDSPLSKVVLIFDMNYIAPAFVADGAGGVANDANIMRFVSYSKWAEGKSLCMQHLCREGDVKSLKDWIHQTKKLMVENRTDDNLPQVPEISKTDNDPYDITQYM
ncbi:hypothetical protein CAPTEDRAFT_225667 [Capitella teleta]|uniref:Caspase family p20 domain-containing protein n=1 Tax=Capitella teleta TaxID=283909 RepID=R7UFD2_CAPTE|nr:hypothetical protein CAPTEDRAFT_225667 [Capitella teleta]|eukprot:ELU05249.1 hypothetical protein CAPTEDRAFT_225667 [Capitella teleta]